MRAQEPGRPPGERDLPFLRSHRFESGREAKVAAVQPPDVITAQQALLAGSVVLHVLKGLDVEEALADWALAVVLGRALS